jgi:hypothetical protein
VAALKYLSPEDFCMAFLAALGARGTNIFDIRSRATAEGFAAVIETLDERIDELFAGDAIERNDAIALLKTRSYLAPSMIGTFDRFETCLRSLQTSIVASLNPDLRDVQSEFTERFATSRLNACSPEVSNLASVSADRFRDAIGNNAN